ncbi:general secretion pathway protein J [Pseudidiomarina maritima]|uniref:Type II secretion system protein J n=1 Tax=Pseudidiomarina maritima TaxID=519453 RepID=A0A1I6GT64_9GAMM|nr:type II secretion system minor pseudopilin GspJ [Pseudidiomarina maritima]SFR45271.1 general secretion pathway protein J [Pseudidiomarina maritima]
MMQRRRGFTLVEVLVTVVIMAVIGLASAAVINAIMRTSEQSEKAIERLEKLQYSMLILEQDIRQMVARDNPTGRYIFIDDGRLGFVRSGWFNPLGLFPRSELQPVAYVIREGNLVREHFNFVDVTESSEPKSRVVLEGVTAFTAKPLRRGAVQGQTPTSQRNNSGDNADIEGLPPALEITIETEAWGTITRVFLINDGGLNEQPSP